MPKPYFLLPLAALLTAGATLQAQTTKGTRLLGLSGGDFTFERSHLEKRFSGTLIPAAGVFVADNLAVGASVPFGYSRFKITLADGVTSRNLSLGLLPWLRYYLPSESRHRVFGELSVGGVFNSERVEGGIAGDMYSDSNVKFQASAGLGYSYFITPTVGLESLLAYRINGATSRQFGGTALNLNLGFRIYLPKS